MAKNRKLRPRSLSCALLFALALPARAQQGATDPGRTPADERGTTARTLDAVTVTGTRIKRFDEALHLSAQIRGLLARMDEDPAIGVQVLCHTGNVHFLQGALPEARATLEQALALGERSFGPDDPRLVPSLSGLGNVAVTEGRPADALGARLSELLREVSDTVALAEQIERGFEPFNQLLPVPAERIACTGRNERLEHPLVAEPEVHPLDQVEIDGKVRADGRLVVEVVVETHAIDQQKHAGVVVARGGKAAHPEVVVRTVVRHVEPDFGAGVEQPLPVRILAHHADEFR